MNDVRSFTVEGETAIAVYNIDGQFYATDDCCTHQKISLADGTLEDDVIECPLHGGSFNVITGEVVTRPPMQQLRTHETQREGETIFIRVING